jgi:hypothetical protein
MLASVVNRHHWASHQLHGESPHRWSLVPPPRTPCRPRLLDDRSAPPQKLVARASSTTILWRRWHPLVWHGLLFWLLTRERRPSPAITGDEPYPVNRVDWSLPTWHMTWPWPHWSVTVARNLYV